MKISEILREAWALIEPAGRHCQNAFAKNANFEPIYPLHPEAKSWDSTGAVQKIVGATQGQLVTGALMCLAAGAMRMKKGVLEVNDKGTREQLEAMWSFAIATAENVERQLARVFDPAGT